MRFSGKVAIIAGGSQGIGRAVAIRLAKEGGAVVICARRKETLAEAEGEIKKFGGTAASRSVDISHGEEVKSLFKETLDRCLG